MMTWDLAVAARTGYQEVRGEPIEGQQAFAHVLVNRLKDGRWGKTLSEVCLWHGQFSGWRSIDPNFSAACRLSESDPILSKMADLIERAGTDPDPTGGATHYYNPQVVAAPLWQTGAIFCGRFGAQLFYKGVK